MAKLSHEKIAEEIALKGYTLVDDKDYTNMNSRIVIRCEKGHLIETTLNDFRKPSFTCPTCDKNVDFKNPTDVPAKKGYRVIAFDQATEKFGVSIFEDGKLIYYSLYQFSGDLVSRLVKAQKLVRDVVIDKWKPDFIIMEDIQYQNGILTYKVLAMLLGVIQTICSEKEIPFECVSPNVWRKYAGTCGKTRREEKMLSVAVVKEKYNIKVSDDVAEAILIGRYGVMTHGGVKISMAFGEK